MFETFLIALVCAILGCLVGYFYGKGISVEKLHVAEKIIAGLEAQLKSLQESYESRIRDAQITAEQVGTTFKAAAATVLEQNARQYHESAQKDLKQVTTEVGGEMELKRQAIERTMHELREQLKNATDRIHKFEEERAGTYQQIIERLHGLKLQEDKLIDETKALRASLSSSNSVRGRWGELVLKNILQQSQLVEGIDFFEQTSSSNEDGNQLRPDFLVRLPHAHAQLAIDAKAPFFEAFADASDNPDPQARKIAYENLARRVRERVTNLAGKGYDKSIKDSLPYVVMFIPSEAAFRAVFDADKELFQWAAEKKIMITSPVTIMPLLLLVGHLGKQFQQAAEVKDILDKINTFYERVSKFIERLGKVQDGLQKTVKSWNEVVDISWNGTQGVSRSVEKLNGLRAKLSTPAELPIIEYMPREISASETGNKT